MVSQHGFSLIELLVVVALLGFLLMLAVPFTTSWSASAKLRDAENQLHQGIGRSKALALRNFAGMTNTQAAAKLCLKSNTSDNTLELKLYQADLGALNTPAKCYSADEALVWQASLPNETAIKIKDTEANLLVNFTCLGIDSRGLQIDSLDADNCQKGSEYILSIGSEDVQITLN